MAWTSLGGPAGSPESGSNEPHGVQQGSSCPADLDADGVIGIVDLLALLAQWGTDPGGPPDLDGDANVGITDLLALLANWGPCP